MNATVPAIRLTIRPSPLLTTREPIE